jgi:CO/xanthine dehydrogenase FAD-binding subunit
MLTYDEYLMPESVAEALSALSESDDGKGGARIVAGATDLLPWAREGRGGDVHYARMIDITRVRELQGIVRENGRIRLGACTTIGRFLSDPVLLADAPLLARCAVWFADEQIREQATVGGSLVNASPAADIPPPLLALNAEIILLRLQSGRVVSRTVPLQDFILGPGKTALAPNELLASVVCDATPGYYAAFEKVGHRRSLAISTVCVAVLVKPDERRERFVDARIAVGGVGPVAARLSESEQLLGGREISAPLIRQAAATAASRVASRTRREYRREVVVNFVARGIAGALRQAGVARRKFDTEECPHA